MLPRLSRSPLNQFSASFLTHLTNEFDKIQATVLILCLYMLSMVLLIILKIHLIYLKTCIINDNILSVCMHV